MFCQLLQNWSSSASNDHPISWEIDLTTFVLKLFDIDIWIFYCSILFKVLPLAYFYMLRPFLQSVKSISIFIHALYILFYLQLFMPSCTFLKRVVSPFYDLNCEFRGYHYISLPFKKYFIIQVRAGKIRHTLLLCTYRVPEVASRRKYCVPRLFISSL